MKIRFETIEPGEELNIHQDKIIHTEESTVSKNGMYNTPILRVWYYEVDRK
jgi:hypothetical protein